MSKKLKITLYIVGGILLMILPTITHHPEANTLGGAAAMILFLFATMLFLKKE